MLVNERVKKYGLQGQGLRENNWEIELNLGHYPYPDYEPMAFWGDSSLIRQLP
jgi:hypothetical protein